MLFVVVGDASLDVTVAPSRPLRDAGDVPATVRLGPGGQGANVAVRLSRRGADVRLVVPLADDAPASLLRESLAADRVSIWALPTARSASVVALLDPSGERTMLSDRRSLDVANLPAALEGAGWIHCSGYPLLDDESGDALGVALGDRRDGVRLSVAGGSVPPEPARVARFRSRLAAARPDVLVASADEAGALLGQASRRAGDAAAGLRDLAGVVIVTAGGQGSAAAADDLAVDVPAAEAPGVVLDSTGTGDAYAAALIRELSAAGWPPDEDTLRSAMGAGSRLGALVARVVGAQARVVGEAEPLR